MRLNVSAPILLAGTTNVHVAPNRRCGCGDDLLSAGRGAIVDGTRSGAYDDLENLSMIQRRSSPKRRCDNLDLLSLSMIEENPPGRRDSSSVLSLSG